MSDTPLTRFLAEQTLARLREMKAEARNEIEQAQQRVAELEADLRRIEQAIAEKAGGRSLARRAEASDSARLIERAHVARMKPSLKDSILSIMRERPEASWSTQEVFDELLRRGLAPGGGKPLNTVGNRLIELAQEGLIFRVARGEYSLTPPRHLVPLPNEEEVPAM